MPPPEPEDLAITGFGLRFEPDDIRELRETCVDRLLQLIDIEDLDSKPATLDALSEVKGMFNRSWRQDQWDWFQVWALIGRPPPRVAKRIGRRLGNLRTALKDNRLDSARGFIQKLHDEDSMPWRLDLYMKDTPYWRGGAFYAMSTRSDLSALRIGLTKDCPIETAFDINEERVGLEPMGLRTAIALGDSTICQAEIQQIFKDYKIEGEPDTYRIGLGSAVQKFSHSWKREMQLAG